MADTWKVTGQDDATVLSPHGNQLVSGKEVHFHVHSGPAKGHTGKVFVPAGEYNAANVKAKIDDHVATMHEVASL